MATARRPANRGRHVPSCAITQHPSSPYEHWRQPQPWLLFGAALVLTAVGVVAAVSAVDSRREAAFGAAIEAAESRLNARLDGYVSLLRATRAHLESTPVERTGFDSFVARLQLAERYPGLRGIGWSPRLRSAQDAQALQATAVAEGLAEFKVWADGAQPPAFAIRYLAPLDRSNTAALGYDMSSEPVRHEAMLRAATSGDVALSGAVVLKQEMRATGLPGFLLYLPLYEQRSLPDTAAERSAGLAGFAYAPVRAAEFCPRMNAAPATSAWACTSSTASCALTTAVSKCSRWQAARAASCACRCVSRAAHSRDQWRLPRAAAAPGSPGRTQPRFSRASAAAGS